MSDMWWHNLPAWLSSWKEFPWNWSNASLVIKNCDVRSRAHLAESTESHCSVNWFTLISLWAIVAAHRLHDHITLATSLLWLSHVCHYKLASVDSTVALIHHPHNTPQLSISQYLYRVSTSADYISCPLLKSGGCRYQLFLVNLALTQHLSVGFLLLLTMFPVSFWYSGDCRYQLFLVWWQLPYELL